MKTIFSTSILRTFFPFILLIILFTFLFIISQSNAFINNYSSVSRAVSIDLFLSIPFIWLLSIRKTTIPLPTVVPVFLLSMFLGQKYMQLEGSDLFSILQKNKAFIAEILFIILESYMVYKIRKAYMQIANGNVFSRMHLAEACNSWFKNKKIANVMAQEFSIFYYLFSKTKKIPENSFTYHKRSGQLMTGLFIGIIFVESFAVHFLAAQWSIFAAWLLTISSTYFALALIAHYKASAQLPVTITPNGFLVQNGLIYSPVEIPFCVIAKIHETTISGILKNKKPLYINSMNQLGNHNLVIELKNEFECIGLYGSTTQFNTLVLELDEKKKFLEWLNPYLHS
jgi:hypothetical protein